MPWPVNLRLSCFLGVLLIAACVPNISTPTPEGPATLAPSPTVLPFLPTEDSTNALGRSNPTSAALPAEGELDTAGLFTPTLLEPTAQHIPLQFFAEDGTILSVSFYGAAIRPAPMILLLHDIDQDQDAWGIYAPQLQALGYNVYLMNLRDRRKNAFEVNWALVISDVRLVIQNLLNSNTINNGQVAIVGLGTGANVAIFACAQMPSCTQTVAISPRPNLPELDFTAIASSYAQSGRRLSVFSADDDPEGTTAATDLNNIINGIIWQRYSSGGRGSELLRNQPDAFNQLLAGF